MAEYKKGQKGLGKGLDALIGSSGSAQQDRVNEISIYLIDNNSSQPRKSFDDEKLSELAESIKNYGVVQPIVVKENSGRYVIVAGERRFRAARLAGLTKVPVIIRDFDEKELLEVSLIENIQRENLNPIEEALAIKNLIDNYDITQEEAAERLSKSRPAVANSLRLLNLPEKVQDYVKDGKIQAGHARAILSVKGKQRQIEFAELIIEKDLSVREAETIAKKLSENEKIDDKKDDNKKKLSPELNDAQERLCNLLGTKVMINGNEKKGKIVIEYYSKDDLIHIFDTLSE